MLQFGVLDLLFFLTGLFAYAVRLGYALAPYLIMKQVQVLLYLEEQGVPIVEPLFCR